MHMQFTIQEQFKVAIQDDCIDVLFYVLFQKKDLSRVLGPFGCSGCTDADHMILWTVQLWWRILAVFSAECIWWHIPLLAQGDQP